VANQGQNYRHSDLVLQALSDLAEPIGSLVKAFPGRVAATQDTHWIDAWFNEQSTAFAAGKAPEPFKLTTHEPRAGELSPLKRSPVSSRVRLISVLPHYFRGFRAPKRLVTLESELILIEGPNSSGKTSLSEAFEWVFTGGLSRRSSGHPRELANCIANEFRPADEQTWVECVLGVDDRVVTIRRVLSQDYTEKAAGVPLSDVYRDGEHLSNLEERALLEELFAGVAPILMQHTLRQFVHDSPENRRQYFERLLQIDELTALIERAVIGDARVLEFVPPTGAVSHTRWEDLRSAVGSAAKHTLDDLEDSAASLTKPKLQRAIAAVAALEFPTAVSPGSSFGDSHAKLQAAHTSDRERRFPFLSALRPPKEPTLLRPATELLARAMATFRTSYDALAAALAAARRISEADLALSRAVEALIDAHLIDPALAGAMTCPLCEYISVPTLTQSRIADVRSRLPVAAAIDAATTAYAGATLEVKQELEALIALSARISPKPASNQQLQTQLKGLDPELVAEATRVQTSAAALAAELGRLNTLLTRAGTEIENEQRENDDIIHRVFADTIAFTPAIEKLDAEYREHFGELEGFVGVLALDDTSYALRDRWLSVAADSDGVVYAVKWQAAKAKAQQLLTTIRQGLIDLRSEIIEDARRTFSDRMTEVWKILRRDTASRFGQLTIPTPRGRGYKLEMEVKAVLNDGNTDAEVDALRVFSESQMNVLGLAAYITRARLLGHRTLIFDDPVQSMDEEHYRSFAGPLIGSLLSEGFQIVVLTHSDQFARDIADQHYGRLSFATLRSRGSRRHGCQLDEGSRRVAERLKLAEALADDGRLSDAWKILRLAIERLYLLAYAGSVPDFDPRSWRTQTAEFMWDNGAGGIVEKTVPDSGKRLRDILSLTAAGAHDKPPRGLTDVIESVSFVKSLLTPLRVGDG
jgi:hypothetical protein